MFMSSAVLVMLRMLRFKQIASIRVISQPYALQNGVIAYAGQRLVHYTRPWKRY